MSRSSIQRFALAALVVLLTAPWSAAAERRGPSGAARGKRPQVVAASPLSAVLSSFFGFLTKEGCMIDPDGLLAPSASDSTTDAGCGIDPDGRCAAVTSDIGCGIDPSGCALAGR